MMEIPDFGEEDWPLQAPFIKTGGNKKKKGPRPIKRDAKSFYDFWMNFTTKKSFEWARPFEVYEEMSYVAGKSGLGRCVVLA